MGKVRINTIGDEHIEKKQKEMVLKRKEAKKNTKANEEPNLEASREVKQVVKTEKLQIKKQNKVAYEKQRSRNYKSHLQLFDTKKIYTLQDAIDLLLKIHFAKFDETVELHINTYEKGISGTLNLPNGSGKTFRISIISPAKDAIGADTLLKQIDSGIINFDILIATPDAMPRLARVARVLGPRGLMPNPKNGTVTTKPDELAQKYQSGLVIYKTESKSPIIHLTVGKISFGKDKLLENIMTTLSTIQTKNIKNVTLKSTMSPAIKIQLL